MNLKFLINALFSITAAPRWSLCATLALSVFAASPSLAQAPFARNDLLTNSVAARRLDELKSKWGKLSAAELARARDAGDAEAEFYYGLTEWDRAIEEDQRAYQRSVQIAARGPRLSPAERQAVFAQWSAVPESELRQAAESSNHSAQVVLASLEAKQVGARAAERGRKAFDWIKQAAEQSLAPAQCEVATRYLGLVGWVIIPTDQQEGLRWLQRSADQAWEPALHRLADLYFEGELLPPDLPKALDCLQKAAAQGCARAQYELARQYANGNGEPRSQDESVVALLCQAARNGHKPAFNLLADHYRAGLGVLPDYIRAIRCYLRGRETETEKSWNQSVQFAGILGLLNQNLEPQLTFDTGSDSFTQALGTTYQRHETHRYLDPDFVPFARVLSAYLKATQRNDSAAMNQIGQWYLAGHFVPKDTVEAYRWFDQAANSGHAGAAEQRDKLKAAFTPEETRRASTPSGMGLGTNQDRDF